MRVSAAQDDERSRIVSSWRKSVCRWVTQLRRLSRFTGRVIGGGPSGGGTVESQWWYSGRRTYAKFHSPSTATAYSVRTVPSSTAGEMSPSHKSVLRFSHSFRSVSPVSTHRGTTTILCYTTREVFSHSVYSRPDSRPFRSCSIAVFRVGLTQVCAIVTRFLRPSNSARLCWKRLNNNLRRRYPRSRILCVYSAIGQRTLIFVDRFLKYYASTSTNGTFVR